MLWNALAGWSVKSCVVRPSNTGLSRLDTASDYLADNPSLSNLIRMEIARPGSGRNNGWLPPCASAVLGTPCLWQYLQCI